MGVEYYHVMRMVGCSPKFTLALTRNKMWEREVKECMVAYLYTYIPTLADFHEREQSLLLEIIMQNMRENLLLLLGMKMGCSG